MDSWLAFGLIFFTPLGLMLLLDHLFDWMEYTGEEGLLHKLMVALKPTVMNTTALLYISTLVWALLIMFEVTPPDNGWIALLAITWIFSGIAMPFSILTPKYGWANRLTRKEQK